MPIQHILERLFLDTVVCAAETVIADLEMPECAVFVVFNYFSVTVYKCFKFFSVTAFNKLPTVHDHNGFNSYRPGTGET